MAREALSQGSWHARHFRKVGAMLSQVVRSRFRGRRNTFVRSGTEFAAGAALAKKIAARSDDSAKGAVISVSILKISGGVGGGGSPPHDARRSDDSTKGDEDRRGDDSAKGALITVNLLQISAMRKVRYRFRSKRSTLES